MKIKEFAKDYGKLCVQSGRFVKKHWLGVILVNVVLIGVQVLTWYQRNYGIFDDLIERFSRKEKEAK